MQICGGSGALTVYQLEGSPDYNNGVAPSFAYIGCFTDGQDGSRVLQGSFSDTGTNSISGCIGHCYAGGYAYAGLEYGKPCHACTCCSLLIDFGGPGSQCYCGSTIMNNYGTSHNCYVGCSGKEGEACGGRYALQMYQSGGASVGPPPSVTWRSYGCFQDANDSSDSSGQGTLFPNGAAYRGSMRSGDCQNFCAQNNYAWAGVTTREGAHVLRLDILAESVSQSTSAGVTRTSANAQITSSPMGRMLVLLTQADATLAVPETPARLVAAPMASTAFG